MMGNVGGADRCPTAEELADLLGDRLEEEHRDRLEFHLGICGKCQQRVVVAVGETSWPIFTPMPVGTAAEPNGFEPRQTFLGRLREAVRQHVGSTPRPGLRGSTRDDVEGEPILPSIRGIEILHELGRGGMGTVYQARQVGLNRTVAIKLLWLGHGGTAVDTAIRLGKGPKALARLTHPHIIQVYQVGMSDGWVFAVFEYVDGGDLKAALKNGVWSPIAAARLVRTLAKTVQYMHDQGVVHCDLKPSNILLSSRGVPKIADFGLITLLDDESRQDAPGSALGTPGYMPPEQATGKRSEIGPASDIHALGAILYELLTGRPPFLGSSRAEILQQVVEMVPEPPSWLCSSVPVGLDEICLRCLQKRPEDRYTSARKLADALAHFLDLGDRGSSPEDLEVNEPDHEAECNGQARELAQKVAELECNLNDTELALFQARLKLAEYELKRKNLKAAESILTECVPRPGRPDYRNARWSELWNRCRTRSRS